MDDLSYMAYIDAEEWEESPNQRRERLALERKAKLGTKSVPKGTCKICGEHIGRGIARHEKACGRK